MDRSSPSLSILVPCYNEQDNVEPFVSRTLDAVAAADLDAEILLIDDGSADDTLSRSRAIASRRGEVRVLHHERNRGIAQCWKTGLAAARGGAVLITDADLQYAAEDVPRFYALLTGATADVIHGRRIVSRVPRYRQALSVVFSGVLNALLGTRLRDAKSGFLCAPRDVFRQMLEMRYSYRCPQHFIVVNAASRGFRIRQEPVTFGPRQAGESFIRSPLRFALVALTDLPRAFWEFRVLNRRGRR